MQHEPPAPWSDCPAGAACTGQSAEDLGVVRAADAIYVPVGMHLTIETRGGHWHMWGVAQPEPRTRFHACHPRQDTTPKQSSTLRSVDRLSTIPGTHFHVDSYVGTASVEDALAAHIAEVSSAQSAAAEDVADHLAIHARARQKVTFTTAEKRTRVAQAEQSGANLSELSDLVSGWG